MLRGGIYHQYQQQLQKLLNDNGFAGDLPSSFYPSIPPGSELMKWLVTSLDNSNFVQPADVALAAEYSQARQALEQDRTDLLALTADQGLHQEGSELSQTAQQEGEWLSSQVAEEDEAALQELQQEHALMLAQLQEMQALERSLDAAQQAQRVQQQHADAAAMRDAKILSTEVAGLTQLNDKLNAQLEGLHNIVKEMHQLITAHGRRWLLLASNMEAYMDEDKRFVDTILQYTATTSSSEVGILANGALPKHVTAASGANSSALDEHAMKELKRLRMAFYLSEMEYVQARAKLAGAQAMASELEAMVGTGHKGSSAAPWLDEGARGQLAARVRALEQQHEKMMQQEVPILVTELAQLQDTYVFQGEGALKEEQLQRRIALVHQVVEALVGQGARHLVVDSLRQQEQRKLQAVLGMVKEAGTHIASLTNCAEARARNYQRAAAFVAANGLTCGGSSSHALSSGASPATASSQPALAPHTATSASSPPSLLPRRPSASGAPLPPSLSPPPPSSSIHNNAHSQRRTSLHSPRGSFGGTGSSATAKDPLLQHLTALQHMLVPPEGSASESGGGGGAAAGSQRGSPLPSRSNSMQPPLHSHLGSPPLSRSHSMQPPLQQQQQQLCAVAQQCAAALTQLHGQMEAVLGEMQAASSHAVPEQVHLTTSAARCARALVFSPPSPPSTATTSTPSAVPNTTEAQKGTLATAAAAAAAAAGGEAAVCGAPSAAQSEQPVLSSPELMAALQQLSSLNDALQAATNEVVVGYQEHTARLEKHKADAALERSVLKMFYLDPQKLEETVTELQSRLDAATAAAAAM